jgi:hypothetical protein
MDAHPGPMGRLPGPLRACKRAEWNKDAIPPAPGSQAPRRGGAPPETAAPGEWRGSSTIQNPGILLLCALAVKFLRRTRVEGLATGREGRPGERPRAQGSIPSLSGRPRSGAGRRSPTFLQCEECDRIDLHGVGWRADIVAEHELAVYCPACWNREFECWPEDE